MFRIPRIHDDTLAVNQKALEQVRAIFEARFAAAPPRDIEGLALEMRDPFAQRFRAVLYVAEDARGAVQGFALVLHEPRLYEGSVAS